MDRIYNPWGGMVSPNGLSWGVTANCLHARRQTEERFRLHDAPLSDEAIAALDEGGQDDSQVGDSSIHSREV